MTTPETKTNEKNGNGQNGSWLRRCHRWLGATVAVFILLLSFTGIALNHSSDWKLDKSFVSSDWLLDAYGIRAPSVTASFADRGRRVTLLGQRLYLDEREVAQSIDTLAGMVSVADLVVVATRDQVLLFTKDGELVERMDLFTQLSGPVERIGRAGESVIIFSAGRAYLANADLTGFEDRPDRTPGNRTWSAPSEIPGALLNSLQSRYRGQGLSLERLVTDVHSGRIVSITGPYLMDAVAILLIILSISGILMWMRPRRKK